MRNLKSAAGISRFFLAACVFCAVVFAWQVAAFGYAYVTDIAGYNEGGNNGGTLEITAVVADAMPFTTVSFDYYDSNEDRWYYISKDTDGSDGFTIFWDTGDIFDTEAKIRATADTAGLSTDPRVETIQITNYHAQSITGYSDPASGTLNLSAHVVPPEIICYFPPNPWVVSGRYSYGYTYTMLNSSPLNASTVSGTVTKVITEFGGSNYIFGGAWVKVKLFVITATTIDFVWSDTTRTLSTGTQTYDVNVPNVPRNTSTGYTNYRSYLCQSATGNPLGIYGYRGDVNSNTSKSSWFQNSSLCAPVRALIEFIMDPPDYLQFGYSLDGGQTFNLMGNGVSADKVDWTISFDTQALNLSSENFIVGTRVWNGDSWCSWGGSASFVLTNAVTATIRTSLSNGTIIVNGDSYSRTMNIDVNYFEPINVEAPEYQFEYSTSRWAFDNWSDGGDRIHDAQIKTYSNRVVTSNYKRQYKLTINNIYPEYTSGDRTGFFDTGSGIYILSQQIHSVGPTDRYYCSGWTSSQLGGFHSGVEIRFDITSAVTISIDWVHQYFLEVSNDKFNSTGASTGWYTTGSTIAVSVPEFVNSGFGIRYRCTGYQGSGSFTYGFSNSTGNVVISSPSSVTWYWDEQYELKVITNAGEPSGMGYYTAGTNVTAMITLPVNPAWERYELLGWTSSVVGAIVSTNDPAFSADILINEPVTVTATFNAEFYLLLNVTGAAGTGFEVDKSGWYEKGDSVTVQLNNPPDTATMRFVPDWFSTNAAGFNYPRDLTNPRLVTFNMNGPVNQLVTWFAQHRFDVSNPSGIGTILPSVGSYWHYDGETVSAYCSLNGGNSYCTGYTGTGSIGSGDTTFVGFPITTYTTISWNWATRPSLPVQYWHPGEAIAPQMNSRAVDMEIENDLPVVAMYDDNRDSIVLMRPATSGKIADFSDTILFSGTGTVNSIDLVIKNGHYYISFVTASAKVYFIHYDGVAIEPVLLASDVGNGSRSVTVIAGGTPHIYYRVGLFGDLVERYNDVDAGIWVEELVDTSVSRYDLTAVVHPINGFPILVYRKGIYLYSAKWDGSQWNIYQATGDEGNAGHDVSAAVDPFGGLFVSYADQSNFRGSRLYSSIENFDIWNIMLVDTIYGGGMGSKIVLNDEQMPHITHHSSTAVLYARYNGTTWENAVVASGIAADGPTFIGFKTDGRPYCLFFNDGVPTIAEAKVDVYSGGVVGDDDDDDDDDDITPTTSGGGGGCFIATAAFGSLSSACVTSLTGIRDNGILSSETGASLVNTYYSVSPAPADVVRSSSSIRALVRSILR